MYIATSVEALTHVDPKTDSRKSPTLPSIVRTRGAPPDHVMDVPQRKRSVRFEGVGQYDGPSSEQPPSYSEEMSLTNGTDTVLHRTRLRPRPSVPLINTNSGFNRGTENGISTPSIPSSSPPSARFDSLSPVSNASTAATSFTSPSSAGYTRLHRPDESHIQSKTVPYSEDNFLPPIQEDNSRYLMIPTQEARTIGQPSVKTVEAAAATKVYLEQQYNSLLIDGPSPRDIRCKRLEQEMSEKGLGHEQRAVAKEQWFRSETDHLRQMRALKKIGRASCRERV